MRQYLEEIYIKIKTIVDLINKIMITKRKAKLEY